MSTYNDGPYLRKAIDSLLSQTYTDFELIIIDDAAQDDSPQILAHYAAHDPRLRVIHNERNLGLTLSLNRGLELARGDYIGRMDADDIAIPRTRLADQVAFLDQHPEIGMLSGDMVYINPEGELLLGGRPIYGSSAEHELLCWKLLWSNPISHITVMLRHEILVHHDLRYRPEYNRAEDYEFWATLSRHTRLYRSEAIWARRRMLPSSVSHSRPREQVALMAQIMERELGLLLGKEVDQEALATLFDLIHAPEQKHQAFIAAARVLHQAYAKILTHPLKTNQVAAMQEDLATYLWRLSRRARGFGRWPALYPLWVLAYHSPRYTASHIGLVHIYRAIQNQA